MSARGSITRRLRIGFVVFALALAATAALTVAAVSRQDETLGEQTTRVQPLQAANIELREESREVASRPLRLSPDWPEALP